MNRKVIIICGKIGCGKTTYADKLAAETNSVVLSCDRLMLTFFDEQLGDKHTVILEKAQRYLL